MWNKQETKKAIKLKNQGYNSHQISKMFEGKYSAPAVRRKLAREGEPLSSVIVDDSNNADGVQTSSTILEVIKGKELTPEDILRAHHFEPSKWEIVSVKNNFWKQTADVTSYQSKITVKPIKGVNVADLLAVINQGTKPVKIENVKSGERNLIIPIFDPHFGWQTYFGIYPYLIQIQEIIKHGYKNIEIILGGDYFHSNFLDKTMTAAGTQLDHADNIQALKDGTDFFSALLETALKYSERVTVHQIPGNHDPDKAYMWLYAMSFKYPDVEIHNTVRKRDAFLLNNVGVMIAHGDFALKRLPMLFATEYSDIWAQAKTRLVFSGHFHTQKLTNEDGVTMYQCGTAKPIDNYEDKNGFTLSRKHMQVLEFDENKLKATYEIER